LHQCNQISHLNDLDNFNNYKDIDKINSQLERADIQKRILTRNIYREYELYLNLVRDLLFISVEKGLNQIYSYPTINDNFLNGNEFYSLFEKKISKLIFANLPFLTVEQLMLNKIEKNIQINQSEPTIVLSGHNWHGGVIGIIASRLKDKYNKPTIIISVENGLGRASARSVLGFDIPDGIRFDSVDVYSEHSQKIHNEALKNGYNLRILPLGSTIENSTGFGISLDELSNEKEIKDILTFIAKL